jgi:hypothetical protein
MYCADESLVQILWRFQCGFAVCYPASRSIHPRSQDQINQNIYTQAPAASSCKPHRVPFTPPGGNSKGRRVNAWFAATSV